MSRKSLPYCTDCGVHIFVEDIIQAALDIDSTQWEWMRKYNDVPASVIMAEWVRGAPFTEIAKRHRRSTQSISKQVSRVFEHAELSAGAGAAPIFAAVISGARADMAEMRRDRGRQ